jgi:hypothetical protein
MGWNTSSAARIAPIGENQERSRRVFATMTEAIDGFLFRWRPFECGNATAPLSCVRLCIPLRNIPNL